MKKHFSSRISFAAICLALSLAMSSCVDEKMSECFSDITVEVVVAPSNGERATSDDASAIEDVVLYVFDSNGNFLSSKETRIGKTETLVHPRAGALTIVCWCNTLNGSIEVTPTTGSAFFMQNAMVSLKNKSASQSPSTTLSASPPDLFMGSATANNSLQSEHVIVPVSRIVGKIDVTVRGLRPYAGFYDNNYSVIVGETKSNINFMGQFVGEKTKYTSEEASFNAKGEFIVPAFNLFPSQEGETISVSIFHGDMVICEAITDKDGNPIRIIADKTIHVLIDFTNNIEVTVIVTGWNETHTWEKVIG